MLPLQRLISPKSPDETTTHRACHVRHDLQSTLPVVCEVSIVCTITKSVFVEHAHPLLNFGTVAEQWIVCSKGETATDTVYSAVHSVY